MKKLFYIQDTTVGQGYVTFNTVNELVKYFDTMIPRAFKMTKDQYVQNLADLGHGESAADLCRVISESFNIGVIRDGKYLRTDVYTASNFRQTEYNVNTTDNFKPENV